MIAQNIALLSVLALLVGCSSGSPTDQPTQGNGAAVGAASRAAAGATTPGSHKMVPEDNEGQTLVVEAEGLRLFDIQSGSARAIAFGEPRDDVLTMLAFLGKPETGTNAECGAGTLDFANWPSGLGLYFQGDSFVGWNLNSRSKIAVTTASGIGVGSSRADLQSAYAVEMSDTTLGREFAAGELFGLLDGKSKAAKITNMWGGMSCNFR